jgi:hypothetical protein
MDPMSPSPSSNSTRRESQKLVEPSFTWKAMFLPPYLHAVLHACIQNTGRKIEDVTSDVLRNVGRGVQIIIKKN